MAKTQTLPIHSRRGSVKHGAIEKDVLFEHLMEIYESQTSPNKLSGVTMLLMSWLPELEQLTIEPDNRLYAKLHFQTYPLHSCRTEFEALLNYLEGFTHDTIY